MSGVAAGLLIGVALSALCTYLIYRLHVRRMDAERGRAREVSAVHLATIEALALAIDAKDQAGPHHLRRVQLYAMGLGQALGISGVEMQGLRTAALLHDIGKLAVPDHILSKPGPLTPEEFQKVQVHSQTGAEIVAAVPFPYPVAPLIRSHHERWDGRGYPAGLRGEEIPLGARVLAVADCFDVLTSDRPYHKAMGEDAALQLLQQEAGRALDPEAVATFVRILPDLQRDAELAQMAADAGPAAGTPRIAKPVLDGIALAHRELYGLYEIAQTLGTRLGVAETMSLISTKLGTLVPFSTCALFLANENADVMNCRFAIGVDASALQPLTIRMGQGLCGWVGRNRRPLVNARPGADLEAGGSNVQTALQSALVCPLVINGRFIGALAVYHLEASFYRDDHRRLLDRVCEQAAAVVHNSIVFEQTREDALTDSLTGLPNTRFMFVHLARELARAHRLKSEVALLVLDLDDFKDVNDHHGHHAGDQALRTVASVLRSEIRPYDICVRYAGDEFIVVLSGCGREEAENKRADLQVAVNRAVFQVAPGRELPLRISAGAAVFPHDGHTYESLLAHADMRMYQDKGRRKLPVASRTSSQTHDAEEGDVARRAAI